MIQISMVQRTDIAEVKSEGLMADTSNITGMVTVDATDIRAYSFVVM